MNQRLLSGASRVILILAFGTGLAACGASSDYDRGPTKAPLTDMNLVVTPEPSTEMSRMGQPVAIPRLTPTGELASVDSQVPLSDTARAVHPDTTRPAPAAGGASK